MENLHKKLFIEVKLFKESNFVLILIDFLIFIRSLLNGFKIVAKGESTNKIHNKIKKEINNKNGKVLLVGCGTSLLDIPISDFQKLNNSHFTVGMSYACHLDLKYDL